MRSLRTNVNDMQYVALCYDLVQYFEKTMFIEYAVIFSQHVQVILKCFAMFFILSIFGNVLEYVATIGR